MKEASPFVTGVVIFIIVIFCVAVIALNLGIQDMKYRDPNEGTEYRRSAKEMGLDVEDSESLNSK